MANQNRLRDACQRANEKAALAALSKSNSDVRPLNIDVGFTWFQYLQTSIFHLFNKLHRLKKFSKIFFAAC
jgi:hypothetical protein